MKPLSPTELRALALEESSHPYWAGRVKQALNWAADVIEAANQVFDEQRRNTPGKNDGT